VPSARASRASVGARRLRLGDAGLGSGAIALAGSEAVKREYLPRVAAGRSIAAFALSEPDAGSDVGALATRAELRGDEYVLNGAKTWISNGGIADFYCVFARTGPDVGSRGISAFVVDADTQGLVIAERIDAAALLAYRAAWLRDVWRGDATREVAMAKLVATESAQRVVDRAVQIHGAAGVVAGSVAEKLYREVRALRIYERASEVQKLIVARHLLGRGHGVRGAPDLARKSA